MFPETFVAVKMRSFEYFQVKRGLANRKKRMPSSYTETIEWRREEKKRMSKDLYCKSVSLRDQRPSLTLSLLLENDDIRMAFRIDWNEVLLSKLENKLELDCMEQYSTRLNCCDYERIIFRNFILSESKNLPWKSFLGDSYVSYDNALKVWNYNLWKRDARTCVWNLQRNV